MHPLQKDRPRNPPPRCQVVLFLIVSTWLLAAPHAAEAQCTAFVGTGTESGNLIVFKVLTGLSPSNNAAAACTFESSMGPVVQCFARVSLSWVQGTAYGSQLPASVSCRWTCNTVSGTCSVTIDNSDGLPVELMGFSIESDDTAADEDEEDPDRDTGPE